MQKSDSRSERLRNLSPAKRMLLLKALQHEALRTGNAKAIPKKPEAAAAVLSFAQQRLLFIDQLYPNDPAYNMPAAVRLRGPLQLPLLEKAFSEEIRRHEILRTTFAITNAGPVQVVTSDSHVTLPLVDLSEVPELQRESLARELSQREGRVPFNLSEGPVVRVMVIRLSGLDHIVVVTMHHIVSDAWSIEIFLRELSTLYDSFCTGRPAKLAPLNIQYSDYAYWQTQQLQGQLLSSQLEYWGGQLRDVTAIPDLPTDYARPEIQTHNGAQYYITFDKELLDRLNAMSKSGSVTLFMLLLAVFQVLLRLFVGHDDIVVGTPVDNRKRVDLESLIGFFLNTLVLRTNLSGNPGFDELLGRTREVVLSAHEHQELPFELLVKSLQPDRDLGRTLLFQVWFLFQTAPAAVQQLSAVEMSGFEVDYGISHYDLRLNLFETPEAITGSFEYNTALFKRSTIERLAVRFRSLLNLIVDQPTMKLDELSAAALEEEHQLKAEKQRQQKQANLDRLSNVRRRAISN